MTFIKSSIVALCITTSAVAFAHSPHAFFKEADTNKDGIVSKIEAAQFADARFAEADANKDGTVSEVEAEVLKQQHKADFDSKAQERFAHTDANKDGKLQKTELPRMPDVVFARLDTNKDAALSPDEMRAHGFGHVKEPGPKNNGKHGRPGSNGIRRSGKGNYAGRQHGNMFWRMDANRDGNVTKAEARLASEHDFTRLDRNADGNITAAEMPQGRMLKGNHLGAGK
jgi:hypothetical protein